MNNKYIQEYRQAIKSGEIVAGRELIDELDNLIRDMDDERYIFDTRDADLRIDFMEHCIRLTKSPFYGKPMKLLLWQKAFTVSRWPMRSTLILRELSDMLTDLKNAFF